MQSNGLDVENEALLEGVLCAEISLIIVDSLELVIQVSSSVYALHFCFSTLWAKQR